MHSAEFDIWAQLAIELITAVAGVQAASAAGVEQVIGARYTEHEMTREIHALQWDIQAARHFQRDQCQGQRLAASAA